MLSNLETLVNLAMLEGHPRRADLAGLLEVARAWDAAGQRWCLNTAKAVFGANPVLEPFPVSDRVGRALEGVLEVFVYASSDARALIEHANDAVTALEEARRVGTPSTLEPVVFAALEASKQHLFGLPLHVAARASLRGLYERIRLLRGGR